jgi:hypothetical protein
VKPINVIPSTNALNAEISLTTPLASLMKAFTGFFTDSVDILFPPIGYFNGRPSRYKRLVVAIWFSNT